MAKHRTYIMCKGLSQTLQEGEPIRLWGIYGEVFLFPKCGVYDIETLVILSKSLNSRHE